MADRAHRPRDPARLLRCRRTHRDYGVGKIIAPAILKGATDQSVIDKILATTQPKTFQYLESQAGRKFLVGDSLTLAAIGIVSNLINYQYLGFPIDNEKVSAAREIYERHNCARAVPAGSG